MTEVWAKAWFDPVNQEHVEVTRADTPEGCTVWTEYRAPKSARHTEDGRVVSITLECRNAQG